MRVVVIACLFSLILLTLSNTAQAVIYKFTDESGRLHFVDDESKIPAKYRQQTTPIEEERDTTKREDLEAREDAQTQEIINQQLESQALEAVKLEEQRRTYQTPVKVRGNRIFVPVDIALGSRVAHLSLLLDTGASATVLHRSALKRLDLPQGKTLTARVAGGSTLDSERIKFKHIEVGPFRERSVYAMVIDTQGPALPFDGLLGMDFLKKHPYQIDYTNEMLLWEMP